MTVLQCVSRSSYYSFEAFWPDWYLRKLSSAQNLEPRCGGEFVIGLSEPGHAHVDYVYMQPGAWGTIAGTQALVSAGSMLTKMGIKIIRQGGSFADGSYYYWCECDRQITGVE